MSNIWNPDEHEDGFVPADELLDEGASYKIVNAVEEENDWDKSVKDLRLYLQPEDDPEAQEIMLRMRMSDRKSSKFSRFLRSLADLKFSPEGVQDLVGLTFTVAKAVEQGSFRDRDDPDKRITRNVVFITASAIGGRKTTAKTEKAAASDEGLIERLLELCDGQTFSAILTQVANDDDFEALRPQISNKSLLNELIEEKKLKLDGRTYKLVDKD